VLCLVAHHAASPVGVLQVVGRDVVQGDWKAPSRSEADRRAADGLNVVDEVLEADCSAQVSGHLWVRKGERVGEGEEIVGEQAR
jgi:hypothetical protein